MTADQQTKLIPDPRCPECDSPCDVVDCNGIPLPRDPLNNTVLPFRDIVKPGDKDKQSYEHSKDDMCRLIICGCPKNQHGVHYPIDKGDPVIGIAGGGATFDPNTGVWTLPKRLCLEKLDDPCNGIILKETDDCIYISVIKSEFHDQATPDHTKNGLSIKVSGPVESAVVLDEQRLCVTNEYCSPWHVVPRFRGAAGYTGDENSFAYGMMTLGVEGTPTPIEITKFAPVSLNGHGNVVFDDVAGLAVVLQPGETKCFYSKFRMFTSEGSVTVNGFSTQVIAGGYTVSG